MNGYASAPVELTRASGSLWSTKRPGPPAAVAYVGIPEYPDVGNQRTEQFAAVIAGRSSIDAALANCQEIASRVGR